MEFVNKIDKSLHGWPNWLRWILVLPIAIIVSMSIQLFVAITGTIFSEGLAWNRDFFLRIINSWLFGYCFVWSGAIMAPKYKFRCAIVLAIIFAIPSGAPIVYTIFNLAFNEIAWREMFLVVLGLIASIYACIQIKKQYLKSL